MEEPSAEDPVMPINRRTFVKTAALGAGAFAATSWVNAFAPFVMTRSNGVLFRPYAHPRMPPIDFVYLADEHEDPFTSTVRVTRDGIEIPPDVGDGRFSVNSRWYVPGFGYLWLGADNGGEYYTMKNLPDGAQFNLGLEFARSRVARNLAVTARYSREGTPFSREVGHLTSISQELLEDAGKQSVRSERAGQLANRALMYALGAGERIEIEHAQSAIARQGKRDAWFGCETRQYVWARSEEMVKRFTELFTFATITHYVWDSWYELFEPREGVYNWGIKDDIVRWLEEHEITIQGRPLFWFHPTVTPEWLKAKSFEQLKLYMEKHTGDLVRHYGDRVLQWEVFNEYHDWANIHRHTPEQITELTRLALDRTKAENPRVVRILNNCCPWAEYAARGRMARMDANRPLRSPRKYLADLAEAGVDYDVLGIQIYFPQRDLSDIARLLERLAAFGKPIYITEIGASSNLVTSSSSGAITAPESEPYSWHRAWDEELQADWLEQVYNVYYSRPYIKAINWYDFSDFRPFIANGGLVREDCTTKQSFQRLHDTLAAWDQLPNTRR
jgi:endo-1,4-beta-xylanase